MPHNPLTPVGLRCRREALGLSRADLAMILNTSEGVIRSWEISKSEPRDPISINEAISTLEDAALDCLNELLTHAEYKSAQGLAVTLTAYSTQADYEQNTHFAQRLPVAAYRACVGRAFQILSDEDIPAEIVSPYN